MSSADEYRGRVAVPRLQLQSDDDIPEAVLRRLSTSKYNDQLAKLADAGIVAVHEEVQRVMRRGDSRRQSVLLRTLDIPSTANWRLQTSSAFCFDEPSSAFKPTPTCLPEVHVKSTPDKVEDNTPLPTTHAALCAMEELGRVGVLNVSLLMHTIDEARASLRDITPEVADFIERLTGAARRVVNGVVDVQQMATYHRRWSLVQGAAPEVKLRLLEGPTDVSVSDILDVRRLHEAKKPGFKSDDDTEDDRAASKVLKSSEPAQVQMTKDDSTPVHVPASPVKMTLSEVESVLGVFNSDVHTPKSTTSSLMKFVNRVSNTSVSEFLSEFQRLGGEEEESLNHISNLNIS